MEDIEKAEEVLRQGDGSKKNSTEDTTSSSRSSTRDSQRDTATATATTTTTTTPHSSSLSTVSSSSHNDRDRTSNLSSRESLREETSSYRRRNFEDRLDVSVCVYGEGTCGGLPSRVSSKCVSGCCVRACVMVYIGRDRIEVRIWVLC